MYTVTLRTIAIILLFHKGNGRNGQHRVVMDSGWKVGHPQIGLQTTECQMFLGEKIFQCDWTRSF